MKNYLIAVSVFFLAVLQIGAAWGQCDPIGPIIAPGTGTFVVPQGVTSVTVEVWGGGGRGGSRISVSNAYGGGGGGAYSRSIISVASGQSFDYSVGQGSNNNFNAGEDTWFGSSATLMAKGGSTVPNNIKTGATGGRAIDGAGDLKYSGGNGATTIITNTTLSGGGGSSAGSNANGNIGTVTLGGLALPGGGRGGNGRNNNGVGENGGFPGGGGGGAVRTGGGGPRTGGNGGNGQIIISYTCPCFFVLDDGIVSGVTIIQFIGNCAWEAPEGLLEFDVLAIGAGGGGGYGNGGGGGGGGIVHVKANIELKDPEGLPASTSFQIQVGQGGIGSNDQDDEGGNGGDTSFDFGGLYQVIAGGGGGGGSQNEGEGLDGRISSWRTTTTGFSQIFLRGGSGGGGAEQEDGGNGVNSGGNGGDSDEDESGGGGGGVTGNGQDSDDNEGGNGGSGRQFSIFDINNRFFSAGGGGGGEDNGNGGSNSSGGAGGSGENGDPIAQRVGRNGFTPGSGGGGGAENARGGNGAKGNVFVLYAKNRILPVEYIYFESKFLPESNSAMLTWATSKEWENEGFEIQKSTGSIDQFEKIGEVAGRGWSDAITEYAYEDLSLPLTGGMIYYRLKQKDFDGDFEISKVLSVKVSGVQFTQGVWRAYPNPTNGQQFKINLLDRSQYDEEPITFRIIHPTSISRETSVPSENEMNDTIGQMIGGIPKGIFVVEISWGQKVEHIKVLKK